MFDCWCLDKTDKLLMSESLSNEIINIKKLDDLQKRGRLGNLGILLREVIDTKECPKEHYKLQKESLKLGWE